MKLNRLYVALLLSGTSLAFAAAPPKAYLMIDHSIESLIDEATVEAMWKENLPVSLFKLYPLKKWGFVSEVEGGFTDAKVCVITARVMLLPRTRNSLVFKPEKTATAFGSQSDASQQQCQALAKAKLGEAMSAIRGSLTAR